MGYTGPMPSAPVLTPFQSRPNFDQVRGCHAMTSDGVLVKILDWQKTHYWGERQFLVREDGPFCRENQGRVGFERYVDENTLTPVDTSQPGWLERYKAQELERRLDTAPARPPSPRL